MFSHIMLGANDLDAAKKFYDATFAAFGGPAGFVDPKGRVMWMHNGGMFAVTKPIDGKPASAGNGSTIAFKLDSSDQVDKWHAAGVANGGISIEDPPGWRDVGGAKLYLAYLRDPDGNKICALHAG